jgi:hypothetical protein
MGDPDIVETVTGALSADMVQQVAEATGETPEATGAALNALAPGVLRLLGERARDPGGAAEIVAAIRETNPASTLNDPRALVVSPPAAGTERVLGEGGAALALRVADHAAVRPESAALLERLMLPLALGAVARMVSVPLGAENLQRLFRDQQGAIDRADPFVRPEAAMSDRSPDRRRRVPTLWALVIGVVLLAVLFFALRSCGLGGTEPRTETALPPTAPGEPATSSTVSPPAAPAEAPPS